MGGSTTRKSYTKIKNFTEKDQVRIKYSHIGKDKKLMLSVYIGEEVYNELTNGQTFKRLQVKYIPNDMIIITPTNEEKEGIVHRYNGKGLFKTTCVRLSLSTYKKLKIRKKDFNNKVVEYNILKNIAGSNKLRVDLIGSKKQRFVNKVDINDVAPQIYVSGLKPIEISAPEDNDMPTREYINGPTPMFVSHDFLNDVRDAIENRLLDMEERFEKRIQLLESLLKEFMEQPLRPLKADKGNSLDIVKDSINAMGKEIVELSAKLFNIESKINVLLQKAEFKNCHGNKSLMEKIFGKD